MAQEYDARHRTQRENQHQIESMWLPSWQNQLASLGVRKELKNLNQSIKQMNCCCREERRVEFAAAGVRWGAHKRPREVVRRRAFQALEPSCARRPDDCRRGQWSGSMATRGAEQKACGRRRAAGGSHMCSASVAPAWGSSLCFRRVWRRAIRAARPNTRGPREGTRAPRDARRCARGREWALWPNRAQ